MTDTQPSVVTVFDDPAADQHWRDRVRASRPEIQTALNLPDHAIVTADVAGTRHIRAWDRGSGTVRPISAGTAGAQLGAISADGASIWWFAERPGGEAGQWLAEPFTAGATPLAGFGDVAPGWAAGVAAGTTIAVAGLVDGGGSRIWRHRLADPSTSGEPSQLLYQHPGQGAEVHQLSADDALLTITHTEHGDPRYRTVRVLSTIDGTTVGELGDRDASLWPLGFSGRRVLVRRRGADRCELLIWDLDTGSRTMLPIVPSDASGEIEACWACDGASILASVWRQGRSHLVRYPLDRQPIELPTPPGVIESLVPQPDGSTLLTWSAADRSWTVLQLSSVGDFAELSLPDHRPGPTSVPVTHHWVPGPAGPIDTLISTPTRGTDEPPGELTPAVFLLHGGPHRADADDYQPVRAAWADAGFTVVQPNFRGSSGFGGRWHDAIVGRPGLTELEDITAVHDWCVNTGIIDPARCVIAGISWGGYLALLAAGVTPRRWRAAIGELPLADHTTAYAEMPPLGQELAASLFGGTPAEVPHRYQESSPITYVSEVTAPVLIVAAEHDERCPIGQIENFAAAMRNAGGDLTVHRLDSGHKRMVADHTETLIALAIRFAREHLG